MSTGTLENTAGKQDIRLCPLSAIADQIETSPDRKLYAQGHPCFERITGEGSESDVGSRPLVYVRKPCRGENTSCPGHPDYRDNRHH